MNKREFSEWQRLQREGKLTAEDRDVRASLWETLYVSGTSTIRLSILFAVTSDHVRTTLTKRGVKMRASNELKRQRSDDSTMGSLPIEVELELQRMASEGEVNFYKVWRDTVGLHHQVAYKTFCARAVKAGFTSDSSKDPIPRLSAIELYDEIAEAGSVEKAGKKVGASSRTVFRWIKSYTVAEIRELRAERGISSEDPFSELGGYNPAKERKELSAEQIVMGLYAGGSLRKAAAHIDVTKSTFGRRFKDYSEEALFEAFCSLVRSGKIPEDARVMLPTRGVWLTMSGAERDLSSL